MGLGGCAAPLRIQPHRLSPAHRGSCKVSGELCIASAASPGGAQLESLGLVFNRLVEYEAPQNTAYAFPKIRCEEHPSKGMFLGPGQQFFSSSFESATLVWINI